VDCVMSEWSAWGNCSRPCASGVQKRTRAVVSAALNGGQACSVETEKYQGCNNQPCGQPCVLSDWSVWSDCDKSCDGGSKTRIRTVLSAPTFGGDECGNTNDTRPCNTVACPIDCVVSDWSAWGTCSRDCGNGTQLQTRYVTNQPAFGGTPCPELTHVQSCNTDICPTDCVMTEWSGWSECTQACGTGSSTRTRTVSEPAANGGLPCGDIVELDPCNTARCPENRAAILVDRIRKLELEDRISTLEELQAKQAAELAASQTADLLNQIGGGSSTSTGSAAPSFLETLSDLQGKLSEQYHMAAAPDSSSASARLRQQELAANLRSLTNSIDLAKSQLRQLQSKDHDVTVGTTSTSADSEDQDEVTDEVDAQGHHHKKHHRRRHHNDSPNYSKFSETAPAAAQLDPVPPLFAHTVAIPAGNNNDFLSITESSEAVH